MTIQDETTTLMNDVNGSACTSQPSHHQDQDLKKKNSGQGGRFLLVGAFFCLVAFVFGYTSASSKLYVIGTHSASSSMTGTGGSLRKNMYVAPIIPPMSPSSRVVPRGTNPMVMPSSGNAAARAAAPNRIKNPMAYAPVHGSVSPGTSTARSNGWSQQVF